MDEKGRREKENDQKYEYRGSRNCQRAGGGDDGGIVCGVCTRNRVKTFTKNFAIFSPKKSSFWRNCELLADFFLIFFFAVFVFVTIVKESERRR